MMSEKNFEKKSIDISTAELNISTRYAIKYKDWLARHGQILDASTGAQLYALEHRYRKPTFALNTPTGQPIATACSSKWSMRMEMAIASTGQEFELTPNHKFGCDCTYFSPTFGQTLTWDHRSKWTGGVEYILLDAQAQPIARCQGGSVWKCMSWGTFGTVEFVEGRVEGEAQRDEVMATGLTLLYKAVVNQQAAIAAGSNSSSSAAAAAAA